jgi:hypothetical protein
MLIARQPRVNCPKQGAKTVLIPWTEENIPLAKEKFVHDRLHIMKMLTEVMDRLRNEEHHRLVELG